MRTVPERWRKSSRSSANTNCVEVSWRKSSYSGGNNECVELHPAGAVRDSKSPEAGVLRVHMLSLLTAVKTGRLDR